MTPANPSPGSPWPRPIKVGYVIYNERPLSGLIRTQVMDVLTAVRDQDASIDITLIAFWQPWVAREFAIPLRQMRDQLARVGIQQIDHVTAYVPSRHFLYRRSLFPVLDAWGRIIFARALGGGFDVIHARSYFASYMAARLKKRFRHRLIFDMRSLFPLEHVTVGRWRVGDRRYRMWREIEAWTMARAEATVGVSSGMMDEIHRINPSARAALIPIAVDTGRFRYSEDARRRIRTALGLGERLVVAYQGSLGRKSQGNNIDNYAPYFRRILAMRPDAHFLVLTPNTDVGIERVLGDWGIGPAQLTVRESSAQELPDYLSAADFGMHVMSPGPDSHTRLGVKVTEYLSCGLPILVNSNVGAAAELAREHDVGAVVDLAAPNADRVLADFLNTLTDKRPRCRPLAEHLFSVERCAEAYRELYHEVCAGAPAGQ